MEGRRPKEVRERLLASLAANQYGVVNRAQLRAAGFSDTAIDRLIRQGRLDLVGPRVFRVTAVPRSWAQQLMAACLSVGSAVWASHRAASALWQLAGVPQGVIEITSTRSLVARSGVTIHTVTHMPECDVCVFKAVPVTNVSRTLLDLGAVVKEEVVEIALDDALRRGLTSVARLRWRLEELGGKGRRGCKTLRALLEVRGSQLAVPESVLETKFRRLLRRAGLPEPILQHRDSDRRPAGRIDFAYPRQKVAIEVDGRKWHSSRPVVNRDLRKSNALNVRGWIVLRFTWEDVMHCGDLVVQQVREALGIAPLFR